MSSPRSIERFKREQPVTGYVETYIEQFVLAERDGVIAGMYHLEGDMLHAIHVACRCSSAAASGGR